MTFFQDKCDSGHSQAVVNRDNISASEKEEIIWKATGTYHDPPSYNPSDQADTILGDGVYGFGATTTHQSTSSLMIPPIMDLPTWV